MGRPLFQEQQPRHLAAAVLRDLSLSRPGGPPQRGRRLPHAHDHPVVAQGLPARAPRGEAGEGALACPGHAREGHPPAADERSRRVEQDAPVARGGTSRGPGRAGSRRSCTAGRWRLRPSRGTGASRRRTPRRSRGGSAPPRPARSRTDSGRRALAPRPGPRSTRWRCSRGSPGLRRRGSARPRTGRGRSRGRAARSDREGGTAGRPRLPGGLAGGPRPRAGTRSHPARGGPHGRRTGPDASPAGAA